MGYSMDLYSCSFFIPKEYLGLALKAVQSLNMYGGKESDLVKVFSEWGWEAEESTDGDICNLYFVGEKFRDDDLLFEALAPYVKAGSWVAMIGEDHNFWRWYFDGERCTEQSGEIVWK
jgi:hypothetical protein